MPETTLSLSFQLFLLGLSVYLLTGAPTALIPCGFALLFLVFGLLARRPSLRMHAMHGVAMLALLGTLGGLGMGLKGALGLLAGKGKLLAVLEQLVMGSLCAVHLRRCVQSFKEARRRQAAAA